MFLVAFLFSKNDIDHHHRNDGSVLVHNWADSVEMANLRRKTSRLRSGRQRDEVSLLEIDCGRLYMEWQRFFYEPGLGLEGRPTGRQLVLQKMTQKVAFVLWEDVFSGKSVKRPRAHRCKELSRSSPER